MEHGREHLQVIFSFDYQPEHVGAFYYLHEALGPSIAARLVMAVWDEFQPGPEQGAVFDLAIRHPDEAMKWCGPSSGAAVDADAARIAAGWCSDLGAAAYQAARFRHVGWLRRVASTWGNDFAKLSLRHQHLIRSLAGDGPKHLVYPRAFGNVASGDSLMLWQPAALVAATLMPRLGDPTYAAMIFRESSCSQPSRRSLGRLFSVTTHADGQTAITIRAKDAWITMLLSAWLSQRMRSLEPSLRDQTMLRTAGLIGNILHILIGNIVSMVGCR